MSGAFTSIWSQRVLAELIEKHVSAPSARSTTPKALRSAVRQRAKSALGSLFPRSWLIVNGPRSRKRIALTFDDGPTELTDRYLEVLGRLGVRATFFLVGRNIERLPTSVARIAEAGHELGGHGFTHRAFPDLVPHGLRWELERMSQLLPGQKLVRPPHGSLCARSLVECTRAGYTTVLWSYDSGDSRWDEPDELLAHFASAPPESGDIVLLHEDQRHTLEALPDLVRRLESAGYELVTVGELFGS